MSFVALKPARHSNAGLRLPQDGFVVRIYTMSSDPALQQELQLKLARKCLHACGISLFDLEKDLHIISECSETFERGCRAAVPPTRTGFKKKKKKELKSRLPNVLSLCFCP